MVLGDRWVMALQTGWIYLLIAKVIDKHNCRLFLHVIWGIVWDRIFMQVIKYDLIVIHRSVRREITTSTRRPFDDVVWVIVSKSNGATSTTSSLLLWHALLLAWLAWRQGMIVSTTLLRAILHTESLIWLAMVSFSRQRLISLASFTCGCLGRHLLVQAHV